MDAVFIRDLSLRGKHGVSDDERKIEQEFLLDIEAVFDNTASSQSDDLADALDYRAFRDIARDVVENNSFKLIERLGGTIAERILEDARIERVSVTVRKPAVWPDAVPGITIIRTRA